MSEKDDKNKNHLKENEKGNPDIIFNNRNTESYQIMKNQKINSNEKGKQRYLINYEEIRKSDEDLSPQPSIIRKRSNSVDLYKKRKRDKERKNKIKKESSKQLKDNNNIVSQTNANGTINNKRKINKAANLSKGKKVSFQKNFVNVIDVESYKQFNIENTSKDPFEGIELLNNIQNINININNNKDEDDGKDRVNCSCLIC